MKNFNQLHKSTIGVFILFIILMIIAFLISSCAYQPTLMDATDTKMVVKCEPDMKWVVYVFDGDTIYKGLRNSEKEYLPPGTILHSTLANGGR